MNKPVFLAKLEEVILLTNQALVSIEARLGGLEARSQSSTR
ncbi:hypothetical protein [Ferrimicrobium acidiphilum]|nr:hypothetical protein [Ferrimicrobium acidiphilum]